MNEQGLRAIIRTISGPNVPVEKYGDWLTTVCPLAEWRHQTGKDTKPSFGYHIKDHGTTICHCFTCGFKRPVGVLIRELNQLTAGEYAALVPQVEKEEFLGADLPDWSERGYNAREPQPDPIDPEMLDIFEEAVGHPYLARRGITDETAKKLGLLYDEGDQWDDSPRIVFPIWDRNGLLRGLTGRAVRESKRKVKDYLGTNKRFVLLGVHLLDNADKVLLVEGPMDCAKMIQYGFPAVACLHSSLTDEQAEILIAINKPVYLFYDNDRAGEKGAAKAMELLSDHVPVLDVAYPRGVKDPDELTREQVEQMLAEAELL